MNILPETNRPYAIDSFTAPLGVSHFWTLSGHMLDFKLETLSYLEEIVGPTLRIRVQNIDVDVPASWNVLIVDKETYTIDCAPIASCANFDHDALLFSPGDTKLKTTKITVLDYLQKGKAVAPEIPKGSAMVMPTVAELFHGEKIYYGVVIGGHDLHRWIGGKTIGDILG